MGELVHLMRSSRVDDNPGAPRPAANDVPSGPAFTLTAEQLRTLIQNAVRAELTAAREPVPVLLDRHGLAAALGCSASQVDKCRARGMPHVRLGESPRFEIKACMEWLRAQKGEP